MALSGNRNISNSSSNNLVVAGIVPTDMQPNVLHDTLFGIEASLNGEMPPTVHTPADRFCNDPQEITKAKEQARMAAPGATNTRPGNRLQQGSTNADGDPGVNTEGYLSAEAVLSQSAISPTGTQRVCTLEITAKTLELFEPLRHLHLSAEHLRLATFVPQLQTTFGGRAEWPGAAQFGGFYALLNPMALSAYVPYCESLADLCDDQVLECFRPMQAFDGFPVIEGIPVWERQEWERIEYYNAFKLYRDMRYAFYNEADMLLTNRAISTLAKAVQVPAGVMSYLARVYQWQFRCNLYDEWMASQQQMRQAIKRNLLFDRHAKVSQALIQKAYLALSKNAEKMSAKDALAMLELGLKYERLSLGLPGDKVEGSNGSGSSAGPSINIVNQSNNAGGAMQVNVNTGVQQQLQDNMKKPDTLLSVLAVLQRSNAFNTLLSAQQQAALETEEAAEEVLEIVDAPDAEPSEERPSVAARKPTGTPGFVFNDVPREPVAKEVP